MTATDSVIDSQAPSGPMFILMAKKYATGNLIAQLEINEMIIGVFVSPAP